MPDPTTRLLAATRRRLALMTFGLVALLVLGIGATTALAGLAALDSDVDRALEATVSAAVSRLGGELPQETGEPDEAAPASADTFVLYLDAAGHQVANPSGIKLAGLPEQASVAALTAGAARDLRTVRAGGISIRILTLPLAGSGGSRIGFVQGGFVLTLHDRQSSSIVATIVAVGAAGLLAAGLVTLLVTGRALLPVRRAIEGQRRFVADASHELRTPVALIRANAEVLQREGLVRDEGTPLADDIVAEADRLSRLVGDLLALAASDARGLTLELGSVDLAAIASETVRGAAALAGERGVGLVLEAPRPVPLYGDRDRLVQLVLILLDNAIAHSPAGRTVTVRVSTTGRTASLSVADNGPGVPAAERERIFEPFTRLPRTRRDQTRGSGLGLAIGSRIVTGHGGSIRAEETPGGGATFVVSLPLGERGTA